VAPTIEQAESVQVTVESNGRRYVASYVVLSPREAQGYPNAVQSTQWSPGKAVSCHSPRRPGISFE
jgi:hypothetical protein